MHYRVTIKKCIISLMLGCVFTLLTLLYIMIPRSGPSPVLTVFILPLLAVTSIIKPDALGELVCWLAIISFWAALNYVLLFVLVPYLRKR